MKIITQHIRSFIDDWQEVCGWDYRDNTPPKFPGWYRLRWRDVALKGDRIVCIDGSEEEHSTIEGGVEIPLTFALSNLTPAQRRKCAVYRSLDYPPKRRSENGNRHYRQPLPLP